MSNMYPSTKTWNPFVGCKFDCVYCKPSFQRQLKRVAGNIDCQDCYDYKPHYHSERLGRIPSAENIFVCGTGDISFCNRLFVRRILRYVDHHKPRKFKTYFFQSKFPKFFENFLDWFNKNVDKVILLTTLETNRMNGYRDISKAPFPQTRFKQFLDLDHSRKALTIEPVLDFDVEVMYSNVLELKEQGSLEYVWFGYDSKNCGLPEPTIEKSQMLVDLLIEKGVEVRGKTLREVKIGDG